MSNYQSFRAVRAGLGAAYRLEQNERYVYTKFRQPVVRGDGIGGAVSSTDVVMNYAQVGNYTFQLRNEIANGSSIVETTADGLLLIVDATANDGMAMTLGRTITSSDTTANANELGAFVVGTDEFFLRIKLDVGVILSCDQISVGFGSGVYPIDNNLDTELDFAGFNIDNGQVNIETVLNNGSTDTTDTTETDWANNGQHTMEVRVNKAGLCKFLYDNEPATVDNTGFVFDSGDVVHAQLAFNVDATGTDPVITVMEWESGLLSSRGLVGITDVIEDTNLQPA